MGNLHSVPKIGFEDIMDTVLKNSNAYILLNTLPEVEQDCLIIGTITALAEEVLINQLVNANKLQYIIIYGRNANDTSLVRKYEQLIKLGFTNVYVYPGGIFEWLLLQEIYGTDSFPTTSTCKDLYKYRAPKTFQMAAISNGNNTSIFNLFR